MSDAINPDVYQGFSNGAEVIDISENLTSNGGQAVQYIARSTRNDGVVKCDPIEDLHKAVWFIEREITRLESLAKTSSEPGRIMDNNPHIVSHIEQMKRDTTYRDCEGDLWDWDPSSGAWSWKFRNSPNGCIVHTGAWDEMSDTYAPFVEVHE